MRKYGGVSVSPAYDQNLVRSVSTIFCESAGVETHECEQWIYQPNQTLCAISGKLKGCNDFLQKIHSNMHKFGFEKPNQLLPVLTMYIVGSISG